ncbi:MAG TPA: TIGR01777 family oxidoreductase [Fulvivirga sp.]|nr:TIGR01777 family oxidoreductase [Fulvivirga sp.]
MSKTILITGGTGMLGSHLTQLLLSNNHTIKYLSRTPGTKNGIQSYQWDVVTQTIDDQAFDNVDTIIHLAGAGIVDKKWTPKRKKEILESRTKSAQLIKSTLERIPHNVETFISASAIGYYGWDTGGVWKKEESRFGDDFLATVTKAWESEADEIEKLNIRVAKIRIGVILSKNGGALPELIKPIKFGFAAALGSGEQFMSWIHIEDLCRIFIHLIENKELSGVFNGVAPNPETNATMTKLAARALNRPYFLPNVPGFILRLILGQRASLVLGGSRVSSEKIEAQNFNFNFSNLQPALADLLS